MFEAIEDLWAGILELTAQFVIPDWGAMVGLLPVFIFILVLVILIWQFRRLWRAAPARRGKQRVEPRTPAGIHMPGPSWSPIFVAVGAFMLFLGLVFGGAILVLGAIASAITMLYWLAEALRTYDHDIGATTTPLPEPQHTGPPPGVHMPGPSFRPILGAIGSAFLFLGLVFGGWLLAAGAVALAVTLVGWLVDATKEYVKTVEADRTGHLENIPAPRTPRLMLTALGILLVVGIVVQAGWLATTSASDGGAATPSGEPPPAGEPTPGGPAPSGPAEPPAADVSLVASGLVFEPTTITGPAASDFTIAFDNQDTVPHNVEIKDASGASVWQGEVFTGPKVMVYDVPAIPAGTYPFLCTVHPTMTGTLTLQ